MIRTAVIAVQENEVSVLLVHAAGTVNGKSAAVGAGQRCIQRQHDAGAVRAQNCGRNHIPLCESAGPEIRIYLRMQEGVIIQSCRCRCGGGQAQHPVSAVDAENLRNRSQLVRRVVFAVA